MRMRFYLATVLAAGAGAAILFGSHPAAAGEEGVTRLSIVSTASGDGELTHCGCKKKQLGGIFRRPTIIESARSGADALLLVDAGNWAAIDKFEPWEKTEFIWDLMGRLDYDAVTPGDSELAWGRNDLLGLYSRHPEVQVVSANVTDKTGALVWDEYRVVERGGLRIAITGVTSAGTYGFNLTRGLQRSDDFDFLDSREALRRLVPRLREEADLVVVLMHELPGDAERIVNEIPGMDVVVVGHNPGYAFNPDRIGNTLMVRAGNRGQYMSVLDLTLDAAKSVIDYTGEGKPLGKPVRDDPEMVAEVEAFVAAAAAREGEVQKAEALRAASKQVEAVQAAEKGASEPR